MRFAPCDMDSSARETSLDAGHVHQTAKDPGDARALQAVRHPQVANTVGPRQATGDRVPLRSYLVGTCEACSRGEFLGATPGVGIGANE